ncbi:MAG TPA: LAGLIDADG family homing endonuclease [Nitrososphaeraceae archaeon]|nr:LAGLIDADG family homing endonuclease [Nitrososphaeraceae archaeon]
MAKNKIWTQEEINFFNENYPNFGAKFCADKLDRSIGSIHTKCYLLKIKPTPESLKLLLSEAQIKYQNSRPNADYNVNVEQFLDIQTPEAAYFLGFLWADGYIVRQEVRLSILTVDMDIIKPTLDKIGKWNYNERVRDGGKPICTAVTNNKKLFDFLVDNDFKIKSGASADKILGKIPLHLKHYFFRGLVDGDGCIDKNGISISSCYNQDWNYVSNLNDSLDINSYIYRKIQKSGKYSVIEINCINGLVFCEYIYKNRDVDNIGLYRKFLKYLELKSYIENGRNYVVNEKKGIALEMYNSGVPITQIMKDINIASTTLRRYLKQSPLYEEIHSTHRITEKDVLHIRSIYKPSVDINELHTLFSNKIGLSGFKKICYGSSWKHLL